MLERSDFRNLENPIYNTIFISQVTLNAEDRTAKVPVSLITWRY